MGVAVPLEVLSQRTSLIGRAKHCWIAGCGWVPRRGVPVELAAEIIGENDRSATELVSPLPPLYAPMVVPIWYLKREKPSY